MLAIQMIREKYIQKAEQKRHRNASNVVQELQEDHGFACHICSRFPWQDAKMLKLISRKY
jgi:hypothetical protein